MSKPTAISLFSGIGGIDLAFSRAGFDVVAQVEIDSFCRKVLAKHAPAYWPNAQQFEDVKNVGKHNLPAADVIFGGFPCQDISLAGKGAGIKEGTRSGLWFEFARIISELRPRVVFLENVPAITTNGGTTVIERLASMGYDAEWGIVSAASIGAPHKRDRWFCVAYANRVRRQGSTATNTPAPDKEWHDTPHQQPGRTVSGTAVTGGEDVAHASGTGLERFGNGTSRTSAQLSEPASISTDVVYAESVITRGLPIGADEKISRPAFTSANVGDTTGEGLANGQLSRIGANETERSGGMVSEPERSGQWSPESGMGRIFDGIPARLDGIRRVTQFPAKPGEAQHEWEAPRVVEPKTVQHRTARIKALGNAVVPEVIQPFAEIIYEMIMSRVREYVVDYRKGE